MSLRNHVTSLASNRCFDPAQQKWNHNFLLQQSPLNMLKHHLARQSPSHKYSPVWKWTVTTNNQRLYISMLVQFRAEAGRYWVNTSRRQVESAKCAPLIPAYGVYPKGTHSFRGINPRSTRDVDAMLVDCWPTVADGGPTANQHWVEVSCLQDLPSIDPQSVLDLVAGLRIPR